MKMNYWKTICLCLTGLSILFLALPALAETTLQVKCIDASGAPMKDVKVFAISMKNPQKPKDKKSDAQGAAEFAKLEDGAYRVVGRKEGFAPALFEFAILKGSPVPVTLKLQAGSPETKLYFEDEIGLKKAEAAMAQAFEAYKAQKFADAEKLFSDVLISNPANAESLYYLSVTKLQMGKYEEAAVSLDKTVEVASAFATLPSPNPSGPNPYDQISQSAQNVKKKIPSIRAENALRAKNYDQALKDFTELVKAEPNNPDFHANLAIAQYNLKNFDAAIASIDTAIKLKPGQYDEMKKTILAQKERGLLEKAQTNLDEGTKLLQAGDATAALAKFEEAKKLVAPDKQWPIWRQIGRAQGKLNNPEAVASFKKALELAPADKQGEIRNAYAQYYLDQKKYDDAVDLLADPKSENPEKTLLGVAKSTAAKEPKMARAALERVLKINPDNIDAAFELGQMIYFDKDNDKRAKELLNKYIEKGQDETKVGQAKDMMVLINRRNK
jgi:tetratricopeptide (TPR) repeat protein